MIAEGEVFNGGAESSDVADCFVAADESRRGFLVTTVVVLWLSQYKGEAGKL